MSNQDIIALNREVNELREEIKKLKKRLDEQEEHMEFVLTSPKGIYKNE